MHAQNSRPNLLAFLSNATFSNPNAFSAYRGDQDVVHKGHILASCLWLLLVFSCDYYSCPDVLSLASACLSKEPLVLAMVVLLWSQLMAEAAQPFWVGRWGLHHGIVLERKVCQNLSVGKSGAKKDPQSQKVARTAPNNFLNNSRGLLGYYPVKQGF